MYVPLKSWANGIRIKDTQEDRFTWRVCKTKHFERRKIYLSTDPTPISSNWTRPYTFTLSNIQGNHEQYGTARTRFLSFKNPETAIRRIYFLSLLFKLFIYNLLPFRWVSKLGISDWSFFCKEAVGLPTERAQINKVQSLCNFSTWHLQTATLSGPITGTSVSKMFAILMEKR